RRGRSGREAVDLQGDCRVEVGPDDADGGPADLALLDVTGRMGRQAEGRVGLGGEVRPVVSVEVHAAGDAGNAPAVVVLPEGPAVPAPVLGGDRRLGGPPATGPERA